MKTLVTYVINLDGSNDRLAAATAVCGRLGLTFERVAAFDGRRVATADLPGYDDQQTRKLFGRSLTGGEIGCYLSHLDCARRFLTSGAVFGLVLEDDVAASPAARQALDDLLQMLKAYPQSSWHLANLGAAPRQAWTRLATLNTGQDVCRAHYFPVTTTALLWTRAGAEAFLRDGCQIRMPVDHFLRYWASRSDMGLACRPAIFSASLVGSEIDAAKRRRSVDRGWAYFWAKQRRLWSDKRCAQRNMRAFRAKASGAVTVQRET